MEAQKNIFTEFDFTKMWIKTSILVFVLFMGTSTKVTGSESDGKYYRIQNTQSKGYLQLKSRSTPQEKFIVKLNSETNSASQLWLISPTAGFPFKEGKFSVRFKITSKNSQYVLENQSSWRLEYVNRDEETGRDVFQIMRPYHDICLVEVGQENNANGIELEDCEQTSDKYWTFIPADPQQFLDDFDSDLSKEV